MKENKSRILHSNLYSFESLTKRFSRYMVKKGPTYIENFIKKHSSLITGIPIFFILATYFSNLEMFSLDIKNLIVISSSLLGIFLCFELFRAFISDFYHAKGQSSMALGVYTFLFIALILGLGYYLLFSLNK